MKLILLGTGGYRPNDRRQTLCLLLPECGIMLDAGTALFRAASCLEGPDLDIFLTHAHLDHVIGLTHLLEVARAHPLRRVTIHAEAKVLAAVDSHLFADALFPKRPPMDLQVLGPEPIPVAHGGRLSWFPLAHPGGSIGYRLDWPGHSMAYVTDTRADLAAAYVERIRGVDLLVHECYSSDAQTEWAKLTGHSHTTPVAEVARRAAVGRLLLAHLNPLAVEEDPVGLDVARAIFPATELGVDRMVVEF
jgi:ribonuclease BN (tRNA processing enzyme)